MTERKAVHPREIACPRCAQPIGAPCLAPSGSTLGNDENPVHHTSRLTGRLESDEPRRSHAPEHRVPPPAERTTPPPPAEPSRTAADPSRPRDRTPARPKRRTARAPHPASPHKGDGEAARADAQPALF